MNDLNFFASTRLRFSLLIFLMSTLYSFIHAQSSDYQEGVIYVKILQNTEAQFTNLFDDDKVLPSYSINMVEQPFKDGDSVLNLVYRIHFNPAKASDSLIKFFSQFPFIEYAEKLPVNLTSYTPNDFSSARQNNLIKVHAQEAWDISKGSSSVVIAVVDNAIRITHHDLAPNIWVNPNEIPNNGIDDDGDGYIDDINGWDVADHDNNPNPPAGITNTNYFNHGSHVSGIAGAATDNGFGMCSLGFNCRIMAVKCTPDTASNGDVLPYPYDGVYYAVKAGANIINMSFESKTPNKTNQSIINYAYNSGIVCIAAAGNDTTDNKRFPANYTHVIGVGATDQNDKITGFSNYGQYDVAVMAPGYGVYSTLGYSDSNYGFMDGTSMAAPLVAGLAGLVLSENIKLNPDQVQYYIEAGCDNIDALNPSFKGKLGYGRINALNTLKLVQANINNFNANAVINLFPNPCGNVCNIRFLQRCVDANFTIILHTILGQKVLEETVSGFNGFYYPFDLTKLPQGLYITQIILPDSSIYTTIFKGEN